MRKIVEYLSNGTEDVSDAADPIQAAVDRAPEWAYAFYMYDLADREEVIKAQGIVGMWLKVIATPQNQTQKHFIGGRIYTLDEVKVMKGEKDVLYKNMVNAEKTHAIHTRTGRWEFFNPAKDIYLTNPVKTEVK